MDEEVTIVCNDPVRKWAYENAYTIVLCVALFVVTWIIMGVLTWYLHAAIIQR